MKKIGFVGVGIMGKLMALNLVKAGYDLTVYDLNPKSISSLVEAGSQAGTSSADVAGKSEVIVIMLPNSPEVKEVVLGKEGVLDGAKAGAIVDRRATELIPEPGQEGKITPIARGNDEPTGLHAQHFIHCIRDGETPRCDALIGHRGGNTCHLANISYKVGQKLNWDPIK